MPLEPRETLAPPAFGRATVREDPGPVGLREPDAARFASPPAVASKQFREARKINVGVSHLSTGDLSPDETAVLTFSTGERAVRIYDRATGKLRSAPVLDFIEQWGRGDVLFWPRPVVPPLAVVGAPGGVTLRDTITGAERALLSPRGSWELRFSSNGEVLMASLPYIPDHPAPTSEQRSELAFYRVLADDRVETELVLGFGERVDAFDLDSHHGRLAVLLFPSDEIEVYDLRARRVLWTAPAPKYASGLDISGDDRFVAVGGDSVSLHRLDDPARPAQYHRFDNNIDTVRFSPDGDLLAVSSYDGRIRTFVPSVDQIELTLLQTLRHGGTANVYSLTFTRDGKTLVSTSGDRTIRIWTR